jgi:hypothetical protein
LCAHGIHLNPEFPVWIFNGWASKRADFSTELQQLLDTITASAMRAACIQEEVDVFLLQR